jgi:tetratricopeptide (TPR) repeat protein
MPEARLGFASFLWAVGRLDEGAAVIKEAADDDPGHAFLSRALGLFYASRGRDAEADTYLTRAASTGDRDSQFVLADYYARRNRSEEALSMLDTIAAGDDPGSGAAARAADIEFRLGRREQAMQRTEKILARDPLNARALRIKAQALFAAGDIGQATTVARAAVAADRGAAEAHVILARSLAAGGDRAGAFDGFAEAWRLNPRDAEVAKELTTLALALPDRPHRVGGVEAAHRDRAVGTVGVVEPVVVDVAEPGSGGDARHRAAERGPVVGPGQPRPETSVLDRPGAVQEVEVRRRGHRRHTRHPAASTSPR